MKQRVIKVSRDQVESARALIELAGGEDKVDSLYVKIANARPAAPVQQQAS